MNRQLGYVFAGLLALGSGGCATQRTHEVTYEGPNPGAEVAKACGAAAFGSLKGGAIMIPVGAGILVACLPLAVGAAVISEVFPGQVSNGAVDYDFTYPDGSPGWPQGSYTNGGWGSTGHGYPNAYIGYYSGRRH